MRHWDSFKLEPKTADEINESATIQGKRKRIWRYGRDNSLVHALLMSAQAQGLSGEDTMTWLAYEALLRVEQLESRILEDLATRPSVRLVFPTPAKP